MCNNLWKNLRNNATVEESSKNLFQSLGAMENQAIDFIRKENAYLKKLLEVSRTISLSELSDFLRLIIDSVVSITNGQRGFIVLLDEEEQYKISVASGIQDEALDSSEFEISDTIVKEVIEKRKSKLIENILLENSYKDQPSVVALHLKAVMCVPLITKEKIIGVIYVDSNRSDHCFSKSELLLFEAFASQATVAIENASMYDQLKREHRLLQKEIKNLTRFEDFIGVSAAMKQISELIHRVLDNSITVLIQGETGTGKEVVARAIHYNSSRSHKPFVVQNCGALTETLLESELFGHKKGSFTGATENKTGLFEAANGGTIFLDEIGETTPSTQVRLLRVLETQTIRRIGETVDRKIDVRVITATNRNLKEEVQANRFREDLYYRLNIFPISIPPLRERKEDISILAYHFVQYYNGELNKNIQAIHPDVLRLFNRYEWKGNIRELKNTVYRMMVLAGSTELTTKDLPADFQPQTNNELQTEKNVFKVILPLDEMQKAYIQWVLNQVEGNMSEAARRLGLKRTTLHMKLNKLENEN